VTNLYHLTSKVRHHAAQHEGHIVIIDYCDVTSTFLYASAPKKSTCGITMNHKHKM